MRPIIGSPSTWIGCARSKDRLFGAAADAGNSNRSRVRIRLDRWESGSLKGWQPTGIVRHPEVGASGQNVGSDLYLGYGPLTFERDVGTTLKGQRRDSGRGERHAPPRADLRCVRTNNRRGSPKALALMNLYGTLGGRSRNGWGSFALEPLDGSPALPLSLDASLLRPWRQALGVDWPHAIGQDEKGALIWQTEGFPRLEGCDEAAGGNQDRAANAVQISRRGIAPPTAA